jgi:hypothetical protein
MARKKIKWNSERLLSMSAMTLSVVTLFIFIWQTNLMSRQNYLSILPYLQFSVHDDESEGNFALSLKNHGVGPAILQSVILEYQDRRYDLREYNNELNELLRVLKPELDSVHYTAFGSLNPGIAIPANTTYEILGVSDSPENYAIIAGSIQQLVENGLRYEIIYKSLQEEQWVIHNDSEGPEKLD